MYDSTYDVYEEEEKINMSTKILVTEGLFSKEVPPNFQSNELGEHIENLIEIIDNERVKNRKLPKGKKVSKSINFSYPNNNIRRNFRIPNPYHYLLLAEAIENNWNEIENFCNKSNISLTNPSKELELSSNKYKSIEDIMSEKQIKLSWNSKYLLKADISRFYHTIYTHSIPWALHGKSKSKKDRSDNLLGNILDELVRNTQDGQTLGIPAGVHTSHIISEIIATAIDIELEKTGIKFEGFRYRDDYYLYFYSKYDAEKILSIMNRVLKNYELELNLEKTKIIDLPYQLEAEWLFDLQEFDFENKNIIIFINKVYTLSKIHNRNLVFKNAMKIISDKNFSNDDWLLIEPFLLNILTLDSSIITLIFKTLHNNNELDKLNFKKISKVLNKTIEYNADFENIYEVCWALLGIKLFDLKLDDEVGKRLTKIENPLIALMYLDLKDNGLIEGSHNLKIWTDLIMKDGLYSSNWILAYEAPNKGWLGSKDNIKKDSFYKYLSKNNISFYDENFLKDNIEYIDEIFEVGGFNY